MGGCLMFERYTDRARRVVMLADKEARAMHHGYVGTEHLLIGFLAEGEAVAFKALDALGVTEEMAREAVLKLMPAGDVTPSGHLEFVPRLKKTLELGLREGLMLGCNYVGTEHLLLGMIRDEESIGSLALANCGIGEGDRGFLSDVREKVLELLRGYGEAHVVAADPVPGIHPAVRRLMRTALQLASADYSGPGGGGGGYGPLALAARDLVRTVDALPAEHQPDGWAS